MWSSVSSDGGRYALGAEWELVFLVVNAARTIHGHLGNVLTYFDHRITNAMSEGLNSKIEATKKTRMVTAIGSI